MAETEIPLGKLVSLSLIGGLCFGLGCMLAVALRVIVSVTRGKRWYQLKQL